MAETNENGISAMGHAYANSAQTLIRLNLPSYIPESMRSKSFAEIASLKNEQGENIGIRALHDAWDTSQARVSTANPLNTSEGQQLRKLIIDLASLSSGSGMYDSQLQDFMIGFDRYGKTMVMPHLEMKGPTFISRPRLCLQSSNLRNVPIMAPLDTSNAFSTAFAIRALLDSNLDNPNYKRSQEYSIALAKCPLINKESPWITPFSNALLNISGFPDYELQAEATEGGWFSEQQQYAIGANDFNQGGTVQCSFREIPGGIISAILFYWLEYMRCVTRGEMLAYGDDIDGQILNYTVSIYSFNMDPSQQYITRWVKCTGCFPVRLSIGTFLNKSRDNYALDSTRTVDTTFIVNKFEYMNPLSLNDFNLLAMKYCPDINMATSGQNSYERSRNMRFSEFTGNPPKDLVRAAIPDSPFANFCGLPYIVSDPNGYRLMYRETAKSIYEDPVIRKLIATDIARTEMEWMNNGRSTYSLYQQYDYDDFYKRNVHDAWRNGIAGANIMSFDKIVEEIKNGTFIKSAAEYQKAETKRSAFDRFSNPQNLA